jgi:hypothetical protein
MSIEFVPARWWQTIDFIRTDFETARGRDPWTDRVLSRPWSPASLLEYGYALAEMPFSTPYFIFVAGERVGTLWLTKRAKLLYIWSLGLLPSYRGINTGMQAGRVIVKTIRCIEDYAMKHGIEVAVGRHAAGNDPVKRLAEIFGAKPLGLAMTTLKLLSPLPETSSRTLAVERIKRPRAIEAWRQWKLHAVEHVAGSVGRRAATDLSAAFGWIDALPKGDYLALRQGDQEIGLAFARRHEGKVELGLLVSTAFWSGAQTAALVAELASFLESPIGYLTLTQKHAGALDGSDSLKFERPREQERYFVFWLVKEYFEKRARRGD